MHLFHFVSQVLLLKCSFMVCRMGLGDLVVAYFHVYYDDRFLEICGYDNEQSNCSMAICCHRSPMAIAVMMSPSQHNK